MSHEPEILGGKKRKKKRAIELDRFWHDERMFNGIIYGVSRSGKTVLLASMLNVYSGLKFNCFVNDVAKGYSVEKKHPRSEILMFFSEDLEFIKGVRIFVPEDCKVDIKGYDYEQIEVDSYDTIFDNLKPDKLNVLCLDTFLLAPLALSRFWALFTIELLYRSKHRDKQSKLNLPMFGAIDQVQHIFPSRALKFAGSAGRGQDEAANWFARFLQDCSGSGIKFVLTSHGISMLKKSIRNSVQWKFFKNIAEDVGEAVSRIRPAQRIIEQLPINCAYATDDMSWGDVIVDIPNVTYKPDPVYYKGVPIKDPHWALKSEMAELIETDSEKYIKTRIAYNERKWQIGHMYSLGYSYKQISQILGINEDSVWKNLKRCRTSEYYHEIERQLRPPEDS